ncbi:DUF1367 family protein [Allosphingosinicella flava]|uniref:DUF1367 family protein n=1 Tax=Allosphingosinicella flava TaxID=2771430 RepID=A0A7T2GKJ0_9SPHN|nr:DUF1367 family protein [Sphingosinicella flava]QPQ55558.1 DUF1367 family protein [Sphingosinicella flava]
MSKIAPHHFVKTAAGFIPKSNAAREFHAKTRLGATVELKARRPRNHQHHRKLFALLGLVADNNEQFSGPEDVLVAIKAATGHGRWLKLEGATREVFMPESIAFDAMSQDEFEPFYEQAVAAVRRWWLPVGNDELEEAINAFAA